MIPISAALIIYKVRSIFVQGYARLAHLNVCALYTLTEAQRHASCFQHVCEHLP